eukprot:TRINITY_DN2889_c0_g1_i1.p1 TRINITY_DN2889_c0_g1~~TRINITY_DN2889_c0_g1_i1.p1  ORF type:complete len:146 (-),score=11.99 TRINITY_DN2889_c0_g1_i1:65-502(-)
MVPKNKEENSTIMELSSSQALLGFVGWTFSHVIPVIGLRVMKVLTGKFQYNVWKSDTTHGPEWYQRIRRSHDNCLQNLPLYATIVLLNIVNQKNNIDHLATWYLLARIGQSVSHLISEKPLWVNIRFGFFAIQIGLLGAMGYLTL